MMKPPPPVLSLLGSYRASQFCNLFVLQGSVLDFGAWQYFDEYPQSTAIVNAANEACLGGGGVDGAITKAGGRRLEQARQALPLVQPSSSSSTTTIRCPTGQAVLTGPNVYGSLSVPYIIHAVGPNYNHYQHRDELVQGHVLLQSAYQSSLTIAYTHDIQSVGFSLLSAGIFKGPYLTLSNVLEIGIQGIQTWKPPPLRSTDGIRTKPRPNVYLCAFTSEECDTLLELCQKHLEPLQADPETSK